MPIQQSRAARLAAALLAAPLIVGAADPVFVPVLRSARTQDFWAPHVSEHGGIYYLYYSAKPDAALADTTKGLCLAVATAERPQGPFADSGRPLQCGPGFEDIDPMAYDDPATGKRLLYWGSGFGPVKVQELARDRISSAPGSTAAALVHPITSEKVGEYQRLIEGAWVVRRGHWYYLFYSGDIAAGPRRIMRRWSPARAARPAHSRRSPRLPARRTASSWRRVPSGSRPATVR